MALSSQTAPIHSLSWCFSNSVPLTSFKASNLSSHFNPLRRTKHQLVKFNRQRTRPRATIDDLERDQLSSTPLLVEDENPKKEVEESVKVLKNAARTRKVVAEEILSALSVIEKAKLDPSGFLDTLGGKESPGRTWMLVFTSKKQLKGGGYFPLTAVQRFDAAAKRIENGVYLGPVGQLTFEGRLSWKKRILAFIFENLRIKIGPLKPLQISLGTKEDTEPNTKSPFFIWFYVDEEIAVARGRSGGTAFWCRCRQLKHEDPALAEAAGIRWALAWTKEMGFDNILLETDNLLFVQQWNDRNCGTSYLADVVRECFSLSSNFSFCSVSHVKRTCNRVADFLANLAFSYHEHGWVEDDPPGASDLIATDVTLAAAAAFG